MNVDVTRRTFVLIAGALICLSGFGLSAAEDDDSEGGSRRSRFGLGAGVARQKVDGGEVRFSYTKLTTDTSDYEDFKKIKAGETVTFYRAAAIKLQTDHNLKVADKTIRAGNVSPDYPGIYTIWIKKTEKGWGLVFNEDGDIWGTMHDPENDVAEMELAHAAPEEPAERFDFKLEKNEENEKKLDITIEWGEHQWKGSIEVE